MNKISNPIPLQVTANANKTYDQVKEAAGGALKWAKEVGRLCGDGSWKDGIGGNRVYSISEFQVATATNAILIPAKKIAYATYGTSENPGKGRVKDKLLEVLVDYPTSSGNCKAIDIKKIHNDKGGFNAFFGNPNWFAPNKVLEIHLVF